MAKHRNFRTCHTIGNGFETYEAPEIGQGQQNQRKITESVEYRGIAKRLRDHGRTRNQRKAVAIRARPNLEISRRPASNEERR
jgi:hypothetical protein